MESRNGMKQGVGGGAGMPFVPKGIQKGTFSPVDEQRALGMIRSYVKNKMTFILFMLSRHQSRMSPVTCYKACLFLEDVYRHMMDVRAQEELRSILKWLLLFFKKYPRVKANQKVKAFVYLNFVYAALGFEMGPDIRRMIGHETDSA